MLSVKSEIPDIFFNNKTGKFHESCILCDDHLLSYKHGYVIEKAFKRNSQTKKFELVFEYALCTECQQSLSKEMSVKSMQNIQKFFQHHKGSIHSLSNSDSDVQTRLNTCMITGEDLSKTEEYQIAGQFWQNSMIVFDSFPFALGETAVNEIQELLSDKTRGFSDKFKDLILPPDVRDKIPDDRLVFF